MEMTVHCTCATDLAYCHQKIVLVNTALCNDKPNINWIYRKHLDTLKELVYTRANLSATHACCNDHCGVNNIVLCSVLFINLQLLGC